MMPLPLSLVAHAVRHETDMTARALFSRVFSHGKRVFQNWQKAVKVSQNKQPVKVVQNKTTVEPKAPTRTPDKLQPLWSRLIPRVYYRTLANELGKSAARKARSPLVAFLGLSLVQQQEQEEIVEDICELVKTDRHFSGDSILFEKIQGLSLDQLEIGRLIGKGCNAAVHEARLKTTYTDVDSVEVVSPSDDEVSSDITNDITDDTSNSINDVISHVDQLLDAMLETDADINDDVRDDITETGSDITVLDFTDDDISDDEAAPTMFLVQSVVETVPYAIYSDSDQDSNVSFEIIEERSDNKTSVANEVGETDVPEIRLTQSRILLTLPPPGGTDKQTEELDGVMENDLEYESMNSTISGENTPETGSDYNLAVKMMFNYGLDSNATAIFEGMKKETIPARITDEGLERDYLQHGHKVKKKLPPHPNIVEMWGVFVDEVSHLPNSFSDYPDALPKRINPNGIGRNMTMYLVMKKYDCTLKEYLSNNSPSFREKLCLFAQLLEAIVHLQNHGIAHRDIKSNNILLDCSEDGVPQLVLSDFGCCLADEQNGLRIPYTTDAICKEGNMALMAPEILSAQPGPYSVLDYSKADLWATGALAYEIFGGDNPFYTNLNSASYREQDLPPLADEAPTVLQKLVSQMLKKNPSQRPSPSFAANLVDVLLWMPEDWVLLSNINHMVNRNRFDWQLPSNRREPCHWLQLVKSDLKLWFAFLAIEVLFGQYDNAEMTLKKNFIRRLRTKDILGVLNYCNIDVLEK